MPRSLIPALLLMPALAAAELPSIPAYTPSGDVAWTTPLWRGGPGVDEAEMRAYFDADMARVMEAGTDEESEELDLDEVAESSATPPEVDEPITLTKTTCISIGKANRGYLINGVRLESSENIIARKGKKSFGTPEVVDAIKAAADSVAAEFPNTYPLPVGNLSRDGGGRLRPHKSHQNGRDADIAFYIKGAPITRLTRARASTLDAARNWAYMAYFIDRNMVEYIFVDYRLQKPLYEYARDVKKLSPEKLEEIFQYPRGRRSRGGIIRHSKGHDDHMHVRFWSPRAVAAAGPYLEKYGTDMLKPLPVYYKVRRGQTLSRIARRHKVTVKKLRKWNRLRRGAIIRPGQKLIVGHRRPKLVKPGNG